MPKKLTQEEFIRRVSIIHPHYNFSNTIYINHKYKIKFICNKHGEVESLPQTVLNSSKCGECHKENKKEYSYLSKYKWSQERFINECIKIHPIFDYSLVDYKSQTKNVNIKCKEHGVFNIRPESFLKSFFKSSLISFRVVLIHDFCCVVNLL